MAVVSEGLSDEVDAELETATGERDDSEGDVGERGVVRVVMDEEIDERSVDPLTTGASAVASEMGKLVGCCF